MSVGLQGGDGVTGRLFRFNHEGSAFFSRGGETGERAPFVVYVSTYDTVDEFLVLGGLCLRSYTDFLFWGAVRTCLRVYVLHKLSCFGCVPSSFLALGVCPLLALRLLSFADAFKWYPFDIFCCTPERRNK